jgi:hypothetical protein
MISTTWQVRRKRPIGRRRPPTWVVTQFDDQVKLRLKLEREFCIEQAWAG